MTGPQLPGMARSPYEHRCRWVHYPNSHAGRKAFCVKPPRQGRVCRHAGYADECVEGEETPPSGLELIEVVQEDTAR